jgi:alpha-tubulin suppressor-like RCC1 family protein
VFCWGFGDGHEVVPGYQTALVPIEMPGTWDAFVMGGHHYCGRTNGNWICWGWNGDGQLGSGDTVTRNAPSTPICAST